MGTILMKWPRVVAGLIFLVGLALAAWGLKVKNTEFSRNGVALAVTGAPFVLLLHRALTGVIDWGRVNALPCSAIASHGFVVRLLS